MNFISTKTKEKIGNKQGKKQNLIDCIEKKYFANPLQFSDGKNEISTGDILRIGYRIPEGEKERIQFYEGLVIAKKNHSLSKTFTIRRTIQGVGIEQVFLLHSPKILSIAKKQSSKIRRAKLYYMRHLRGKATRLKIKR